MQRKFYSICAMFLILGLVLAACGGGDDAPESTIALPTTVPATDAPPQPEYSEEDIAEGQDLFVASCSACHGAEATGVEGLGKGLLNNEFVQDNTDEEMMEFIKVGRLADDPLNTTGVVMPPKGGNPAMSDDQIVKIIAFLRSLQ